MTKVSSKVTVKVPGSIANLGPGFDVFALALTHPHDLVTVETSLDKMIKIQISGLNADSIPLIPELNTAGLVAKEFTQKYSLDVGFRISIKKGISHSRGLGSSGASSAATAYAINHLLDLGLSKNELISMAALGEVASSGSPHADNVSAAILGGFTLIRLYDPMDVYHTDPPKNLGVCIATPKISLPPRKTAEARKILPEIVTLKQLTHNVGHAATLAYAMTMKDIPLIGRAMNDVVVEPVRANLIPAYESVKNIALKHGSVGVAICGAGPSIAAFYDSEFQSPEYILAAIEEEFKFIGIDVDSFHTTSGEGVQIF
jgi:homoserine kinase